MKGQRVDFDLVGSGDVKGRTPRDPTCYNNETFHLYKVAS